MANTITFTAPDFLKKYVAEDIQERMMKELPAGMDDMPGGFPYDFTMPSALVMEEFANVPLAQTLQLMFPQFAWGQWLDLHGERVNVTRKQATEATGIVHVEGPIGTLIPKGTVFCTVATDTKASIRFVSDSDAMIYTGAAEIPVTAEEAGTIGNVIADTIKLTAIPISSLSKISNTDATSGGTEIETDDDYRERILEAYRYNSNYVGCNTDYHRWALEVDGVKGAAVIPEWNGPGTVKLVIRDSNGDPASEAICERVFDHIIAPDEPMKRLAPIGATLTVVAPTISNMTYSAQVELEEGTSIDQVASDFSAALLTYYETAMEDREIKYSEVGKLLIGTTGVYDYHHLTINGVTDNIPIDETIFPKTSKVTLTEGEG